MRRLAVYAAIAALSSLATVAAVALPALADDDGADTTAAADRELRRGPGHGMLGQRFREFRDCLAEQGLTPGRGGQGVDADALRQAREECGDPFPSREQLEAEANAYLEDVASRLDVTVARLKEALKGAALARVDRLVAEDVLTEAQAERLKERIESGDGLPGLHGPLGGGPHRR